MSDDCDPEEPRLLPEEEPTFGVPRFGIVRKIGGWGVFDNLTCTYLKDFHGRFRVFKRERLAQQVADFQNERTQDD